MSALRIRMHPWETRPGTNRARRCHGCRRSRRRASRSGAGARARAEGDRPVGRPGVTGQPVADVERPRGRPPWPTDPDRRTQDRPAVASGVARRRERSTSRRVSTLLVAPEDPAREPPGGPLGRVASRPSPRARPPASSRRAEDLDDLGRALGVLGATRRHRRGCGGGPAARHHGPALRGAARDSRAGASGRAGPGVKAGRDHRRQRGLRRRRHGRRPPRDPAAAATSPATRAPSAHTARAARLTPCSADGCACGHLRCSGDEARAREHPRTWWSVLGVSNAAGAGYRRCGEPTPRGGPRRQEPKQRRGQPAVVHRGTMPVSSATVRSSIATAVRVKAASVSVASPKSNAAAARLRPGPA